MVTSQPQFGVVIPACNEAGQIEQCLATLMANRDQGIPFEVVVIDNGSTDGTQEIVRNAGVRVVENTTGQRRSISALRNEGARSVDCDILLFLDADMLVPDNLLETAARLYAAGLRGMLAFPSGVPQSAGWVGRVWGNRDIAKLPEARHVDFLNGRNIFIARNVFDEVGGFDEDMRTSEDKDLTWRVVQAGYEALYSPELTLVHLGYEHGAWELARKEFWRQRSSVRLARKHGWHPRMMRGPFLSAWHFFWGLLLVASIFGGCPYGMVFSGLLWVLPSGIIATGEIGLIRPLRTLQLALLTFLRWNASGLALVDQLLRGAAWSKV